MRVLMLFLLSFLSSQFLTWDIHAGQAQSRPFWLYGSAGAGYGSLTSDLYFRDNPVGAEVFISGNLSYLFSPDWIADGGLGWMYSTLEGKLRSGTGITMVTRAGFGEINPRYRFNENWQFGPSLIGLFGTDTGFRPVVESQTASMLGGGKLIFEVPSESTSFRVFTQFMTDLGLADRQLYFLFAGVQFGIPLSNEKPAAKPTATPRPTPVATPVPVIHREVRISLAPRRVYFETDSASLKPGVETLLMKIGSFLNQNDEIWESVQIFGHADARGGFDYNLTLSKRRGESVMRALALGGARPIKMQAEAFSYARPAVSGAGEAAWSKNRRVELIFKNVSQPDLLKSEIERLSK